ncbi:unnamed protein product [Periconia digitata]|uniref:Uncharacterized protein n=1 Tax=Periconia digitata TaxID=1303443 RepID=A0A9W4U2R0_9PLEO|nr:unnamed protein product [Periconia digitata]
MSRPPSPPQHEFHITLERTSSPLFEPDIRPTTRGQMNTAMEVDPSLTTEEAPASTNPDASTPPTQRPTQMNLPVRSARRACTIKKELEGVNPIHTTRHQRGARVRPEDNPENQMIVRLRKEDHMSWGGIAAAMNSLRRDRGEEDDFTEASVYGRFIRNGHRISINEGDYGGDAGFDPKDYLYLRHPAHHLPDSLRVQPSKNWGSGAGRKRVREEGNEEQDLKGNLRPKMPHSDQKAELETPVVSEMICQAVNTVNSKFWIYVADELDRAGGKYYEPGAVQMRFNAIGKEGGD